MVREIRDDALLVALRSIGEVRAPSTLLPAVLEAVGAGVQYASVDTAIGEIWVAWTSRGVRAATRNVTAAEFERAVAEKFGVLPQRAAMPADLQRAVHAKLDGDASARIRFDLAGLRPFEQDVLQTTLRIPRGEVRPYNWVARRIGRPLAVRAVGTALANNPIPFLIPCHRVVRADGHLGNYGAGGTTAKRAILGWEGLDAAELETLARRGIRYLGSDTTRIFCYPSCHNARRITAPHRVPFRDDEDARRAGYRACKVCMPAAVAA